MSRYRLLILLAFTLPLLPLHASPLAAPGGQTSGNRPAFDPEETDSTVIVAGTDAVDARGLPDMSGLLVAVPDAQFPLLQRSERISLVGSGAAGSVENIFKRTSRLLKLTDDYALIQLSGISTLECRIFSKKKGGVLAMIHTVSVDSLPDSQISFLDAGELTSIPVKKLLKEPKPEEFFDTSRLSGDAKRSFRDAFAQVPFFCVRYRFTPSGDGIEATLPLRELVSEELWNELKPCLRPAPLIYRWNGKKFLR